MILCCYLKLLQQIIEVVAKKFVLSFLFLHLSEPTSKFSEVLFLLPSFNALKVMHLFNSHYKSMRHMAITKYYSFHQTNIDDRSTIRFFDTVQARTS